VVKLTVLDGLLLKLLPVGTEETIVQINRCLSDQVISEEIVIVDSLDDNGSLSGEVSLELEELVELRLCFVELIVVAVVENVTAARDLKVGVTGGADVTGREIVALQHVELDGALGCGHKLLLDDFIVGLVFEELQEGVVLAAHALQSFGEPVDLLLRVKFPDVEGEFFVVELLVNLRDQFEDFAQLLRLIGIVLQSLFFVVDVDATLEVADNLFVADLTRGISLGVSKTEPRLFESSALATLDVDRVEGHVWEQVLVVFKFISVVPSVVLLGDLDHSFFVLVCLELGLKVVTTSDGRRTQVSTARALA